MNIYLIMFAAAMLFLLSLLFEEEGSVAGLAVRVPKLKLELTEEEKKNLSLGFVFAVLFAGLARNFLEAVMLFSAGFICGFLALKGIRKVQLETGKEKRLKEISVLFEAVEIYLRAGYTLPQAMRAASLLTPGIKKEVVRCINSWAYGPRKALEEFRNRISLPEADILISLLIQIEAAGVKNLEGVMKREAENIDRLRSLKIEAKIAKRPLYMMLYRIIPLIVALVLIVGPLLYRTYVVMVEAGISPF